MPAVQEPDYQSFVRLISSKKSIGKSIVFYIGKSIGFPMVFPIENTFHGVNDALDIFTFSVNSKIPTNPLFHWFAAPKKYEIFRTESFRICWVESRRF